jgi:outer membrane protein assembly factor BamB
MRHHEGSIADGVIVSQFECRRTALAALATVKVVVLLSGVATSALAGDASAKPVADSQYPLSKELAVLERDLTSGDYRAVLATMIPTDLEAEWQRVATADNYLVFAEQHGGEAKMTADPVLKSAYERRRQTAYKFLGLIREAYAKRRRRSPFDDVTKLQTALRSAGRRSRVAESVNSVAVHAILPAPGAERQWPRLRGPDGQGTTFDSVLPLHWGPHENIVWTTDIPGRGNSSPVVWDDRIFVTTGSDDGKERKILCFARRDGRLLWQQAAPSPSAREGLYKKNTFASSTPVTDGQRVIAFFGNSGLLCVDLEGHQKWHVDLGLFPTMHGPGTSPVLYKDEVICIQYQNHGKSLFAAFDKRTGAELWRRDSEHATSWSTPVVVRIGDRDQLVYNGASYIAGYDPQNGKEIWRVTGTSSEAIPTVVVGGGLLYSASGRNGPTMGIRPIGTGDITETSVMWRNLRGGPHVPSPLYHERRYHEGRVYIVNDTGIATCIDAADGRTVWQHRLRGRFSMSPIIAEGRILVTSEEGRSTILQAADTFQVLAENDLDEPVLATPALLGGQIYFRTASHLLCVGSGGK